MLFSPNFYFSALPQQHEAPGELRILPKHGRNKNPTVAIELKIRGMANQQALKAARRGVDVRQGLKLPLNLFPNGLGIDK